jgi:hypothetical protein
MSCATVSEALKHFPNDIWTWREDIYTLFSQVSISCLRGFILSFLMNDEAIHYEPMSFDF